MKISISIISTKIKNSIRDLDFLYYFLRIRKLLYEIFYTYSYVLNFYNMEIIIVLNLNYIKGDYKYEL